MEQQLFIKGAAGQLEARLQKTSTGKIGIICHPHPQYGGNMDNNVVHALKKGIVKAGYSSLRFNFRGVGKSDGTYGEGTGEADDLIAVIEFCKKENYSQIVISGYSFGAWVIVKALKKIHSNHLLILVSPPIGIFDFGALSIRSGLECLVITGTDDYICPLCDLKEWLERLPCKKTLVEIHGSDHFYIGKEAEISRAVSNFLNACKKRPDA